MQLLVQHCGLPPQRVAPLKNSKLKVTGKWKICQKSPLHIITGMESDFGSPNILEIMCCLIVLLTVLYVKVLLDGAYKLSFYRKNWVFLCPSMTVTFNVGCWWFLNFCKNLWKGFKRWVFRWGIDISEKGIYSFVECDNSIQYSFPLYEFSIIQCNSLVRFCKYENVFNS